MESFAYNWESYGRSLPHQASLFEPVPSWTGAAAEAAAASMKAHQQWLLGMQSKCTDLAEQARHLIDAHKTALDGHPRLEDVQAALGRVASTIPELRARGMSEYAQMQQLSQEKMTAYAGSAHLPPVQPEAVPSGAPSMPPVGDSSRRGSGPGAGTGGGGGGGSGGTPQAPEVQPPSTPTARN